MAVMFIVMVAMVMGFGVLAAVAWLVGSRNKNLPAGVLSSRAQIVSVREIAGQSGNQHWVKVQFPDGHQRELMATPSQAEVLTRGQQGTAHWIDDRLTGWVPELGRGPQDAHRSD
ncbi:hypothetical protein [Propionimicrobium sp. PCR01-08-3]|uniref:hypothetical protein n=1 Tax=Propionimicrobium sp. PCR01-08-3 TaxID=3052086 RepID=UPI00255C3F49|nr:hypothetical protein [Propionimicrobium sp. PCR01-08-3]WIY82759.1 hypothetical protein QQ658_14895 [Propionimicrobium sp. PCR01-08-3]